MGKRRRNLRVPRHQQEDKLHLAEFLSKQAGNVAPRMKLKSLRGTWQNAFPLELDLDAELKEIRSGWEKEWEGDEFKG